MAGVSSSKGIGDTVPPGSDAPVSSETLGRYAPVARLGTGGMADVFLTVAHGLQGVNKLVVVKRLRNADDHALTEMFLDEARLGVRLNHPNIVHTYEVGEVRGEYFIAMEYLDGQPLSSVLRTLDMRCEGLPEPLVAFIAIQVLKGLHHAHEFCDFDGAPLGVVHRDVSPHNLFLTYGGEIKLLDFGIAKATLNATHTEDGVLKGKVRYMAPEQATQTDLDRRVDIHAFGVVLWEMLARRSLFTGPALSILTRIVNEEVPPVRGVRPDVSPALEAIALKACRRKREERYATAEEMRLDLEAYVREHNDGISERDVAQVMNRMFADLRDDVRSRIKSYVATMPAQPALLHASSGINSTGRLPVLPSLSGPPSAPSLPTPAMSEVDAETTASLAPPRSRWPLVLIALLFAAGGAAAFFVLRAPLSGHSGPTPPAVPAASAPAAAATPTGPQPEKSPAEVHAPAAAATTAAAASRQAAAPASAPPAHPAHVHALPPPAPSPAPSPAAPAASPSPAPPASTPERPNIRMLDDSKP